MKKIIIISLSFLVLFCLVGCSSINSLVKKIPILEDANIDSLTEKAEKAWDEVGKDALKDAAGNAADTILGNKKEILWPENDIMVNVPKVPTGIISNVSENNSMIEITIEEITSKGYDDYISLLTEEFGEPVSDGMYNLDDRFISVIYNDKMSSLVITASVIKQNVSEFLDSSLDESIASEE